MNLEGKCLEEFNEWFDNIYDNNNTSEVIMLLTEYYSMPDPFKWGVLQDYFDELETKNEFHYLPVVTRGIDIYFITYRGVMERFNSRPEARTAAIESACKLRNEQLNSK